MILVIDSADTLEKKSNVVPFSMIMIVSEMMQFSLVFIF